VGKILSCISPCERSQALLSTFASHLHTLPPFASGQEFLEMVKIIKKLNLLKMIEPT
jgi:hypothetical protein